MTAVAFLGYKEQAKCKKIIHYNKEKLIHGNKKKSLPSKDNKQKKKPG